MTTKEAFKSEESEEIKKLYYTKNGRWLTKKALRCGYVDIRIKGEITYKLSMTEIGYVVDSKNRLTYSRKYFDSLKEAHKYIQKEG